ncbi:POP1 ribonuclease P/MRP subunit [Oratosquilla oratoria]|uniref:POP1 ribonuclease P/MRP subunit n=1 Tax=Oratosquilla oratoria TaxID=337810 RepID=UPI003F76DE08
MAVSGVSSVADELPQQCSYLNFGAARIQEIQALTRKLAECEHGARAYQNLPRHMQRRAVSSNPNRLPVYLREKHKREIGSNIKKWKRPSRKHRRRPSNLLQEYNRRQHKHVWLETHIWHAKRFHIKEKWGYKVPQSSTNKGHRAAIRAATKRCLLQDISYSCCVEVEGPEGVLVEHFSKVVSPHDLAALICPDVKSGKHWVKLTLYNVGQHPYGALGCVDVIWAPVCADGARTLWLWSHPSAYNDIKNFLMELFQMERSSSEQEEETENITKEVRESCEAAAVTEDFEGHEKSEGNSGTSVSKDSGKGDLTRIKLALKDIPSERIRCYSDKESIVKIRLLKDTLNRFSLTGPGSYSVMSSAFRLATLEFMKGGDLEDVPYNWWQNYYAHEDACQAYRSQEAAWKKFVSCPPPPKVILPLTLRDPRLTLAKKKGPPQDLPLPNMEEFLPKCDWETKSPIWNPKLRDIMTLTKKSDQELNAQRSENLVPGGSISESPDECRVAVLLLAKSSGHPRGLGSGWDIIFPAGWSMALWISLIYSGAVVCGEVEENNLHLEVMSPYPSHLFPDTQAGERHSLLLAEERRRYHFARPPSNRLNFLKLGAQYPFFCPWQKLMEAWHLAVKDFYVVRDPELLAYFARKCGKESCMILKKSRKDKEPDDTEVLSNRSVKRKLDESDQSGKETNKGADVDGNGDESDRIPVEDGVESQPEICLSQGKPSLRLKEIAMSILVPVKIVLMGKGTLEPCAMICVPKPEDWKYTNDSLKRKSSLEEIIKLKKQKCTDEGSDLPKKPCLKQVPEPEDMEYTSEISDLLRRKPSLKQMGPVELPFEDKKEERRKSAKGEHKKIKNVIKKMRQKAIKEVNKRKEDSDAEENGEPLTVEEAYKNIKEKNKEVVSKFQSYSQFMESLWLIDENEKPFQRASRLIMGFVTQGGFSIVAGRGVGLGFVAGIPLLDMTIAAPDKGGLVCLVRNPSSLHYLFAKIHIAWC